MFQPQQILSDRYQLQQALGHTALGRQTWLGIDLNSQEQVIIKLLAFSPQMQWQELKLFEREAQILQSLQHPRIPRYRNYFELDKSVGEGVCWFVLVQDYIPGNSLQNLLDQNKHFSETEIRAFAEEILEILIYLHELNPPVLHRDIKPSNLILGQDNHIYLIDFGAVQGQTKVTGMTFTVVGTSGYAPLEQFWGRAVPSSDIYGLGATLIHLLTGVSPIDLPHENSQIKFADRVTLKADLLRWIQKATQMAVENRFRSSREALNALQSGLFLSDNSVHSSQINKSNHPPQNLFKNKLSKPLESAIIFQKDDHTMNINFPCFSLLELLRKVPYLLLFLLVIALTVGAFFFIFFLLSSFLIVRYLEPNNQCTFNLNSFEIRYQIFKLFTIYRKRGNLEDIQGVFLCLENAKNDSYQVKIITHNNSYVIGTGLKEREAAWLAQEIQDWLHKMV